MSGRKKRTNPLLLFIVILVCLFIGMSLTRSSVKRSIGDSSSQPDTFVAMGADPSDPASDGTVTDDDSTDDTPEPTLQPTATPVPTVKSKEQSAKEEASPEAAKGVWTPSGSNWLFLVDGTPYTGWLIDLDGHHYFFNSDGIMQTGWIDDGGKRYYLDLDGIMQTGEITVGKKTYQLLEDGSLADYEAEAAEPETEPAKEEAKETTKETKKADNQGSTERKTIALTFDDGPSSFTNRLLDCLEANNAKATFFLVGEEASYFQEEVKRIDSLGCEIGNHTYSHADLTTLSSDEIASQIGRTDELITELTGHATTVLRPPYGAINDDVTAAVTTPMFIWSVDTEDWKTLDAQQTIDNVLSQAQDGAVILMHDIYSETVDAAEVIIPKLIEQGYELVTVHELAEAHGVELKAGIAYGALNDLTTAE